MEDHGCVVIELETIDAPLAIVRAAWSHPVTLRAEFLLILPVTELLARYTNEVTKRASDADQDVQYDVKLLRLDLHKLALVGWSILGARRLAMSRHVGLLLALLVLKLILLFINLRYLGEHLFKVCPLTLEELLHLLD